MSLIHWWPLTGNLNDIVGGKPFTCGSATYDAGKLGNGIKLTSADLNVANPFIGLDNWSLTFWMCDNGGSAWSDFVCFSDNLNRLEIHSTSNNWYWYSNSTTSGAFLPSGTSIKTDRVVGIWHHIAMVKSGANAHLYIDGTLEKSGTTATNFTSASAKLHFNSRANTSYGKTSYNDIRAFNHALSKAEIKELVRAKVLHYTFDDDFAEPTTNLLPSSLQNKYVENVADAASYTITSGLTASAYTLSANIKRHIGDQSPSPYFSLNVTYSDGTKDSLSTYIATDGYNIRGTADDQFHHYRLTVLNPNKKTVTQVNGWILDRGGYTSGTPRYMTVQNAQLEAKDHATPYTPTSRGGALANEAGYYCSNGANDVEFAEVSRIGQRAIYCKDGLQRISATVPYLASDVLTTSVWFKSSNTSPKNGYHIVFTVDSGRVEISVPSSGNLRWGGYNIVSDGSTQRFCGEAAAGLLDGKWHLLTTVYDGAGWIGYVDGGYKGKQTQTKTSSGVIYTCSGPIAFSNKKVIIGRYYDDTTSNYGATNAYIDDVRVYNTVLTEKDIKDIYNIGMRITKSGDFIANNFVECSTGNLVTMGDWVQEGIQDANGISAGIMNNRLATKYIPVLPSTEYYYAANSGINVRGAHYYTKDLTWIRTDQPTKNSFTAITPDNCAYVRFVIQYSNASNAIPLANIGTYGVTMCPAQLKVQSPMPGAIVAQVSKKHVLTCLDVCEKHSPKFFNNGKTTAEQIIEI